MRISSLSLTAAALLLLAVIATPAVAQAGSQKQTAQQKIVIKAHRFQPDTLTIAAGKRVAVTVVNQSGLPAEFEGKDFSTEKVIPGGTTLPVYLGPLDAGTYHFYNEFAPSVTGTLHVK